MIPERSSTSANNSLSGSESFSLTASFLRKMSQCENSRYPLMGGIAARLVGIPGTILTSAFDTLAHLSMGTGKCLTGAVVSPYNMLVRPFTARFLAPDDLSLSSGFSHLSNTIHTAANIVLLPCLTLLNPSKAYATVNANQSNSRLQEKNKSLSNENTDASTYENQSTTSLNDSKQKIEDQKLSANQIITALDEKLEKLKELGTRYARCKAEGITSEIVAELKQSLEDLGVETQANDLLELEAPNIRDVLEELNTLYTSSRYKSKTNGTPTNLRAPLDKDAKLKALLRELEPSLSKFESFSSTASFLKQMSRWENSRYPVIGGMAARLVGIPGTIATLVFDTFAHLAMGTGKCLTGVVVSPYNMLARPFTARFLAPEELSLSSGFAHLAKTIHTLIAIPLLPVLVFLNPSKAYATVNANQSLADSKKEFIQVKESNNSFINLATTLADSLPDLIQKSTEELNAYVEDITRKQTEINQAKQEIEAIINKSQLPPPPPSDDELTDSSLSGIDTLIPPRFEYDGGFNSLTASLLDDSLRAPIPERALLEYLDDLIPSEDIEEQKTSNKTLRHLQDTPNLTDLLTQSSLSMARVKKAANAGNQTTTVQFSKKVQDFLNKLKKEDTFAFMLKQLPSLFRNLLEALETAEGKLDPKKNILLKQIETDEDIADNDLLKSCLNDVKQANTPDKQLEVIRSRIPYYEKLLEEITNIANEKGLTGANKQQNVQSLLEQDVECRKINEEKAQARLSEDKQKILASLEADFLKPTSNISNLKLQLFFHNQTHLPQTERFVENFQRNLNTLCEKIKDISDAKLLTEKALKEEITKYTTVIGNWK